MESLIQQRLILQRRRLWGLWFVGLGVVLAAMDVVLAVWDPSQLWAWVSAAAFLGIAVTGLVELIRARRAMEAFEAEHGVGAGRQD